MKGIEIRPLSPKETPAGNAYEWCKGVPGMQVTLFSRKPGTFSGKHYHLGTDPSRNPERCVLLQGEALFIACNGAETLDQIIKPFTEILISPLVMHALRADAPILFAEYRKTPFNPRQADTYLFETFIVDLIAKRRKVMDKAIARYVELVLG
jgi:hypothetical protein